MDAGGIIAPTYRGYVPKPARESPARARSDRAMLRPSRRALWVCMSPGEIEGPIAPAPHDGRYGGPLRAVLPGRLARRRDRPRLTLQLATKLHTAPSLRRSTLLSGLYGAGRPWWRHRSAEAGSTSDGARRGTVAPATHGLVAHRSSLLAQVPHPGEGSPRFSDRPSQSKRGHDAHAV